MILKADPKRCVGCMACVAACMEEHTIAPEAVELPLCHVERRETENGPVWCFSTCLHCENPKCMAACPAGCFTKDESTGLVLADEENCIGCGACEKACPVHSVSLGKEKKARKCDGCISRVLSGRKPACVSACPWGGVN
jgi:Fe-S-cluster-containing dehydrogenase component